jgi:hypothetical protein
MAYLPFLPSLLSALRRDEVFQEGHLQTGYDSEAGHPRLGLKTQGQGGAKVDSAGAALGEGTPSLSLSSHRFAFLPPI